jgi:hypothetical protein
MTKPEQMRITEYRGAAWFDGKRFTNRSAWVRDSRFIPNPGGPADHVVDLAGRYVVPPYGEGHNHWLEPDLADAYIQEHLRDGIFYVKDQGTPPLFHQRLRPRVNRAGSVDYVAAHQGFTGPAGHPIEIVDQLSALGVLPTEWSATHGEGDAMFAVATENDLDWAWPRLSSGRPDFIKVFLIHSDQYAARRDDRTLSPKARGIDPTLVPAIVKRARVANLKVSAHIENAHDFHVAVSAGVDEIAHMPFVEADDLAAYRLADSDLALPKVIATTFEWADDADADDARVHVQRDNLTRLRAAGWTIVIGSDRFRETARTEVDLIARLELMTNLELLRAWSIDTPRSIFPERAIGLFESGAEASFLVLAGNPLEEIAHSHAILSRVKSGEIVEPGLARIPPLEF